jgi:hypothetical protein
MGANMAAHVSKNKTRRECTPEEKQQKLAQNEKRRQGIIARFREQQRATHQFINVVELLNRCAVLTTAASIEQEQRALELVYLRFAQSARAGEFESHLRFLVPQMSRWRLRKEEIKLALRHSTHSVADTKGFWADCWLPNELARQWAIRYGYPWPSHFGPGPQAAPVAAKSRADAGRAAGAPEAENKLMESSRDRTRTRKGGRKPGSGLIDDEHSLHEMLRLLAEGTPSVWAAAKPLAGENDSTRRRLAKKFRERWGCNPEAAKTWRDVYEGELTTE